MPDETENKGPVGEIGLIHIIPEKKTEGKNYFIGIGIDEYQLPKLKLSTCVNDCVALSKILVDEYSFELVENLLNENATIERIKALFKKFRQSGPTSSDSLIIFFSGHGFIFPIETEIKNEKEIITNGKGCWVTYEAKSNKELDDLYQIRSLIDEIEQLKMLHILVISDCCHSGTILEQPGFYNSKAQLTSDLGDAPSRWAICSSRSNELSQAVFSSPVSRFTERLIYELKTNIKSKFLLKSLTSNIEEHFNEKKWQNPISGPLDIIANNGGQFIILNLGVKPSPSGEDFSTFL